VVRGMLIGSVEEEIGGFVRVLDEVLKGKT
jgi:hypothetical protein